MHNFNNRILPYFIFLIVFLSINSFSQSSHIDSLCNKVTELYNQSVDMGRDIIDYLPNYSHNNLEYEILNSFKTSCKFIKSDMLNYISFISIVNYLYEFSISNEKIHNTINEAIKRILSDIDSEIKSINTGLSYTQSNNVSSVGKELKNIFRDFESIIVQK